jgi:hypothetical protein
MFGFGKKKKRTASSKKGGWRKFNAGMDRDSAYLMAKHMRNQGHIVKVVKHVKGYTVYTKSK